MRARARVHAKAAGAPLRYGTRLRSGQLDVIALLVGPGASLEIRTGLPALSLREARGQLLAVIPLPERWLAPAVDGRAQLAAPLQGEAAAAGLGGHFRILDARGDCCIAAPIQFDAAMEAGDLLTIAELALTAGNE